jgi:hypothetical protein
MASGDFDIADLVVTVDGKDVTGELLEFNIGAVTGQNPSPIPGASGRMLAHVTQRLANHVMVELSMAQNSSTEGPLDRLAQKQTSSTVSIEFMQSGIAKLPNEALISFTSDKVMVSAGAKSFNDTAQSRGYSLSCIGFIKEYKNGQRIVALR